ncbi:hypothetical protein BDR04DRAFT_1165149 [Suillus decipiens]|nr:hypothetical protein BDR04DRAFT_1165149 [Suillus decipiens]
MLFRNSLPPPPTCVCRPHLFEPCQQLLTCTGRLRMAFVVLGMAWWSSGPSSASSVELSVWHSEKELTMRLKMEPIFPRINDNSHRGKLVSCPLCSDLIAAEHELQLGVVFQTCAPLHSDLQHFLISMITLIVASWFPVLCALTLSLSDLIAAEHELQLGVAFQTCAPLCSDLIAAEHELRLGVAFQTCA